MDAALPRFFEDYKKNENKEVVVADEIKGAEFAKQVVRESLVRIWEAVPACFDGFKRSKTKEAAQSVSCSGTGRNAVHVAVCPNPAPLPTEMLSRHVCSKETA